MSQITLKINDLYIARVGEAFISGIFLVPLQPELSSSGYNGGTVVVTKAGEEERNHFYII
jgi:hypothetical protein